TSGGIPTASPSRVRRHCGCTSIRWSASARPDGCACSRAAPDERPRNPGRQAGRRRAPLLPRPPAAAPRRRGRRTGRQAHRGRLPAGGGRLELPGRRGPRVAGPASRPAAEHGGRGPAGRDVPAGPVGGPDRRVRAGPGGQHYPVAVRAGPVSTDPASPDPAGPDPAGPDPAGPHLASTEPAGTGTPRRKRWRSVTEMVITVLAAALVAVLLRTYACQSFYVPSASMVPT